MKKIRNLVKIFLLVQVNSKIEPLNSQYRNKFQTNKLAERFLAPPISFQIILQPILILNNLSSGSFLNNFIY